MRGKWLAAVSLLLPIALSGCASNGHWFKSDMAGYDMDVSECTAWSRYTYLLYPPNYQPPMVLEGFDRGNFSRCMKSRGYEWVKEEGIR